MLTFKEISVLPSKPKSYYKMDSDKTRGLGSLGVRVLSSGRKQFVYIYRQDGKRIVLTIGDFPVLSLSDAREKAKEIRYMLSEGKDPKAEFQKAAELEAKREAEMSNRGTIKQLIDSYVDWMERTGKRTFKITKERLESEIYPHIPEDTKASEVKTSEIVKILAGMINRGAPVESNRIRTRLHAAFNYGLKHDNDPANMYSEMNFDLKYNPVTPIPKQTSAEGVGNNFLSLNEIHFVFGNFLKTKNVGRKSYLLLKLCFYSGGQRPNELCLIRREYIRFDEKILFMPGVITKNKADHTVPLTDTAIAIIEEMMSLEESEYLFPKTLYPEETYNPQSLAHAVNRFRKEHPDFNQFVPRDIRRTCKTLMGKLRIPKEIRDKIQNHAMKSDVSAKHYDRYDYLDEKRWALELWESHLNGTEINNVVPIATKKALY